MGGSEYGTAYTVINSAFEAYIENLQFRRKKRDSEYSHHPLSWNFGVFSGLSPLSDRGCPETKPIINNYELGPDRMILPAGDLSPNGCEPEPQKVDCSTEEQVSGQFADNIKLEVGTQTGRFPASRSSNDYRKPFAQYAIGSNDSASLKRTFNVKCEHGVSKVVLRLYFALLSPVYTPLELFIID
ncbi:unnamed protein product [Dicrocoelium dendriticum]|nr:unnamed protein product [Dicrocoelium dendriticum]